MFHSRTICGGLDEVATRLQIVPHHWKSAIYTVYLGETAVSVRNPAILDQVAHRKRMVFTWPDGSEYSVVGPSPPDGAIEIISPFGITWSGLPVDARLRRKLARPAVFFWFMQGQVITCEAGRLCCRAFPRVLTLREWDGRRLATWFVSRTRCGVFRGDLREDMKPVILGMILSSMYEFQ